ncbi:unnamed protein product [Gordionus sp. m RMFG-2023]|uniref:neurogenic locus notch homolog protein 1-like n=1 Tax=Gordionus sp. m RMFG-2023 TaxID=3053472 RepID=UPI0030E1B360
MFAQFLRHFYLLYSIFLFIKILRITNAMERRTPNFNNNGESDDYLVYKVNLNVLREGNKPLKYNQEFLNQNSATFLRIADKAEKGLNSIFCRDTFSCNPLYVGSQLSGFEPSLSGERNVQIVISLYWRPQYQGGVYIMTKAIYDSLASNNGYLGTTDLFVGPIESISKSYTYTLPIMTVNGRQVTYNKDHEDPNSRAYISIAEPFTNSMDSLFRSSQNFVDLYIACNVKDLDPIPIVRNGIMVTYTIYLLQNYTQGPNEITNFIKEGFTSQDNNCLPGGTLCTIPVNTEHDLIINIVRKGYKRMTCPSNFRQNNSRDYTYLENTFERGMRQIINASPNIRQHFVNLEMIDVSDSLPLGCLFRYRITLKPVYKRDSQSLDSEISSTINNWGRNCLGSTNLCVNKIPGECSLGQLDSCGDSKNNQICVLDENRNNQRTICKCKPGYIKTSQLGPCFYSTCSHKPNNSGNNNIFPSNDIASTTQYCGGRPFETCTFNPRTVRMECDCIKGYRRSRSPDGPCVRAQCDLGSNSGCFANQECAYGTNGNAPNIECRCKNSFIQLKQGGPCVPRTCDPDTNIGCATNEVCKYNPLVNKQPICECENGFYKITSNQLPDLNSISNFKGNSLCIRGACDPIRNTGCPGSNEICTFSSQNPTTGNNILIYCACSFGFIRTHTNQPCLRNLCDPRTHIGCKNNQYCSFNEVSRQYECQCKEGFSFNYNKDDCLLEICNVRTNSGCNGPNEYCTNDKSSGTRCVCKSGFIRHVKSNNYCVPSTCSDGTGCGENEECVFVNENNRKRLECQCILGYIQSPSRVCIKIECDVNSNQGCRQNEICAVRSNYNNNLPFCECKAPQFYKIGDTCVKGSCSPIDNSGCKSNEICKIDYETKQGQSSNPYCTCAKGYIKSPLNAKSKSTERDICVASECDPYTVVGDHVKNRWTLSGQCQQNEQCTYVVNKIGKGGQYKCLCQKGFIRIPAETGICYRAECEPATNNGCNKPEICSLIGNIVKCICPYNYRKLSSHPDAPCIYAACDPIINDGCSVNEICKIFLSNNEIKCVCSTGYIRDTTDQNCIRETTTHISAEIITYCRKIDEQLINCGPYSECILINGVPICRCLPGYIKDSSGNCRSKWEPPKPLTTSPPQTTKLTEITTEISIETSVVTKEHTTLDQKTTAATLPPIIIIITTSVVPPITCENISCGPNQICRILNNNTAYKNFTNSIYCDCLPGFIRTPDGKCLNSSYPGTTDGIIFPCNDEYCNHHGHCRLNPDGTRYCECDKWWIGKQCQHNGKLLAILAPLLLGLLLLLCCCLLPLCWCFGRKRKKRMAENIKIANQGMGDYGKIAPYVIPRPMISPIPAMERETMRGREVLSAKDDRLYKVAKPEETTEITEETTTEEWKRTYKKPKGRRRYEERRSTTPIMTSKKTRTEDIEEEETAEYTDNHGIETDNENNVYIGVGGKRQWVKGSGEGESTIYPSQRISSDSYQINKKYAPSPSQDFLSTYKTGRIYNKRNENDNPNNLHYTTSNRQSDHADKAHTQYSGFDNAGYTRANDEYLS